MRSSIPKEASGRYQEYFGEHDHLKIARSAQGPLSVSASGGVATELLIAALKSKYVDSVVGVVMDTKDPSKPRVKLLKTPADILAAAGSKYSYIPFKEFEDVIMANGTKRLAVVGVPCIIAAIRKHQVSTMKNVAFLIGLFCGYNMPQEATDFLLKKMHITKKCVKRIDFRAGKYPGGFSVTLNSGKKRFLAKYHYDYLNLMFNLPQCDKCRDYMAERADISVGDAWGYPDSSVVVIRNAEGEDLFIKANLQVFDISPEKVYEMHKHNIKHKKIGDSLYMRGITSVLKSIGRYLPLWMLGGAAKARRMMEGKAQKMTAKQKWWTLKEVGVHWDNVEFYDEINAETYSHYRRFIDSYAMADVRDGQKLLDVCCRTASGAIYYGKRKKLSIVCMDVSDRMLEIARESIKAEGLEATVKKFETLKLPAKDNEFDLVLDLETIEHIPYPWEFIAEMARVMKDDGQLILSTPNVLWEPAHWFADVTKLHHGEGPHKFIRRKKLLEYFKNSGLKVVKERSTVLIPIGPKWLTDTGRAFENWVGETFRRVFCLRRIFVLQKISR